MFVASASYIFLFDLTLMVVGIVERLHTESDPIVIKMHSKDHPRSVPDCQ